MIGISCRDNFKEINICGHYIVIGSALRSQEAFLVKPDTHMLLFLLLSAIHILVFFYCLCFSLTSSSAHGNYIVNHHHPREVDHIAQK